MTIDEAIGARIKARRRRAGLSHADVANALRISTDQIMRHENGTGPLKVSRLFKVAKVLGVKPGYFFEGIDG